MGMESTLVIRATDLFSKLATTQRTVHFLSFENYIIIKHVLNLVTERRYLPTNFHETNHHDIAYHLLMYLFDLVFFLVRDKSGGKRPLCCHLDLALSLVFGLIPCEIDLCGSTTFSGTGRMSRTRR